MLWFVIEVSVGGDGIVVCLVESGCQWKMDFGTKRCRNKRYSYNDAMRM